MRKISLMAILSLIFFADSNGQVKAEFPNGFTGHWKGKLNWVVAGQPTRQFTMQIKIRETVDTAGWYHWHISYGDSVKDERPYILRPVDKNKGHWVIDEGNGIILDNYVFDNCLQGSFSVMNNTIINNYCVENEKMKVEFFTIRMADKKTSGMGSDESPTVDSYRMAGYQYGILEKVN